MELDDFKSTWQKFSSAKEKSEQLAEEDIRTILKKRTINITEKIRRNIRIGIGIILAWIILSIAIDFVLTPVFENFIEKPYLTQEIIFWAYILDAFNYTLIFSILIIFWIRYNKFEKTKIDTNNLKNKVTVLIQTLNSYRRMFYIVLCIIIIYVIIAFSSGFILGYNDKAKEAGINISTQNGMHWLLTAIIFVLSLGIVIAIYYLLFTLFFKRLYGRYLKQLKSTLCEIEESTSLSK